MNRRLTARLLAGVACAAFLASASAISLRYQIALTPSGKIDMQYRNGDDGTAGIPLKWAAVPALAGVQGTPQTVNLRSLYLTEPGAPAATLTTVCTPAIGGGWSTTADGLSYTFSGAYSGVCETTAVRGSFSAKTIPPFALTSSASAGADTTGPSQVYGLTATAIANGIRLTWGASSDPKVASQASSGLKQYQIYRDGSGTPLATVLAPDTGLQVQLLGNEIGGSTGGSVTQTGNNYSILSAGDGVGGTAETGMFAHMTITGDFRMCADMHTITGGNSTAQIVLMDREDLNSNTKTAFTRANPTSLKTRGRTTTGNTTVAYGSTPAVAPPAIQCLVKAGNTWASSYSLDGNSFTNYDTTMAVVMPANTEVGLFVGTGGSTPTTGDIRNFTLTKHPNLVYDDLVTDGASHSYVLRAVDVALNLATASAAATATAPASADVTAPGAPSSLTGGTSANQTTVSWTWVLPSDVSGIRGCTPSISATLGGTYVDQPEQVATSFSSSSGITAGTQRFLKVRCTDNAGNTGVNTSGVSATSASAPAADSTPPTVPSGGCTLSSQAGPCATGQTTSVIRIVTTGSTDVGGCGVAEYRLYRSNVQGGPFALVTSFTTLSFDYDTGGAPSTQWFFKLTARDCASPQNESAQSNTFTGTTTAATGGNLLLLDSFNVLDACNVGCKWNTSTDAGATRAISATQFRDGPTSIRHTVNGNLDTAAHAELQAQAPGTGNFTIGQVYWLGESVYVDDPNISEFGWYFITQFHGANQGTADNPMMNIGPGTTGFWKVQILGDETNAKPYGRNIKVTCSVPVALHAWTDIVMRFRFGGGLINGVYYGSATGGFWQIWIKNASGSYVQCVNDVGNNYFPGDTVPPYVKLGIYKGFYLADEPGITSRAVYHDEIRIGRESQGVGFADVEPR